MRTITVEDETLALRIVLESMRASKPTRTPQGLSCGHSSLSWQAILSGLLSSSPELRWAAFEQAAELASTLGPDFESIATALGVSGTSRTASGEAPGSHGVQPALPGAVASMSGQTGTLMH